MRYRSLLLLLNLILLSYDTQAQDPVFSQFYASPLQINPAFAGTTIEPRVSLNYRNQWTSLPQAYVTYAASYEQFLEPLNSGLGFFVLVDDAGQGIYKRNHAAIQYSYRVMINRDVGIKFGAEAGLQQSRVDWNKLVFLDQLHPAFGLNDPNGNPNVSEELPPVNNSTTFFDVGTGLLFYSPVFYVGLSAKHINTPQETLLQLNENLNGGLPVRYSAHIGAQFEMQTGNKGNRAAFISPNLLLIRQGDFGQVNAGMYAGWGMIFGGAWYRHAWGNADAVIALFGVQQGVLKIGYSYDITVSSLGWANTGGSHEISLTLNFDQSASAKRRRRSSRYNDCLQMFR